MKNTQSYSLTSKYKQKLIQLIEIEVAIVVVVAGDDNTMTLDESNCVFSVAFHSWHNIASVSRRRESNSFVFASSFHCSVIFYFFLYFWIRKDVRQNENLNCFQRANYSIVILHEWAFFPSKPSHKCFLFSLIIQSMHESNLFLFCFVCSFGT